MKRPSQSGWSTQPCQGAEICASPHLILSRALLPPNPPFTLKHDRGAVGAAGAGDACQQGDRVSSEPAPCLSHGSVD